MACLGSCAWIYHIMWCWGSRGVSYSLQIPIVVETTGEGNLSTVRTSVSISKYIYANTFIESYTVDLHINELLVVE